MGATGLLCADWVDLRVTPKSPFNGVLGNTVSVRSLETAKQLTTNQLIAAHIQVGLSHNSPLRNVMISEIAGCDARELDEFCRCKEQAELRCGLIDYWSAPGPTHDPCHKRAMQEFHSCLDKLRDDGERSGSLPKCMQDKISQAIDDMFSPGSTTEGIQAAKDYCAHKDEEGATSGLMNRIGTSIRDQQEAKKRDSTIPRGGIYGN